MAQLANLNPKNAVIVSGAFGTFQSYFSAWFAAVTKRLNAGGGIAAVASADAAAAPGAYNQAHIQTVVAELNETKRQLNALLTALNS